MAKYITVVGSGLTGATAARILTDSGFHVCVLEQRNHIGGNVYTRLHQEVPIHVYGPHIFHTNSELVWGFVNRFCSWYPFVYAPRAVTSRGEFSFPITLTTLRQLLGNPNLSTEQATDWLNERTKPYRDLQVTNQEEQWLKMLGGELYGLFFKHYSLKQWGTPLTNLLPVLGKRVPIDLTTTVPNYFPNDRYQALPVGGYTRLIEGLLKGVEVKMEQWVPGKINGPLIYTGMLDALFDYDLGKLPYRSLQYDHIMSPFETVRRGPVYNISTQSPSQTRVIYHHGFLPSAPTGSGYAYSLEYPIQYSHNDPTMVPMYPMPTKEAQELAREYRKRLADINIIVGGRLGGYKYINMDVAILEGAKLAEYAMEATR